MGIDGERAMLLLLRRALTELRHCCRQDLNPRPPDRKAAGALPEVTDIFTTALPMCASAIGKYAGERAISASVRGNTASFVAEGKLRRAACGTLARPLPGACVTGGIRTRIFQREVSEIFTTSVG